MTGFLYSMFEPGGVRIELIKECAESVPTAVTADVSAKTACVPADREAAPLGSGGTHACHRLSACGARQGATGVGVRLFTSTFVATTFLTLQGAQHHGQTRRFRPRHHTASFSLAGHHVHAAWRTNAVVTNALSNPHSFARLPVNFRCRHQGIPRLLQTVMPSTKTAPS